ncbi:MAG: dihydrodipicolinate synthase family protein [Betaproteobacteria bacterium]|nr:dihydrodipicolinate synthase family protein [Betaproteobacteria bacterium]
MTPSHPFHGIYPMMYAFFDRAGKLDRDAMRRQIHTALVGRAHGVAILGLATEVGKLSAEERRLLVEWAAADLEGRVPLAVTVAPGSVQEQTAFGRWAADRGAAWIILQPPPERGLPEEHYAEHFSCVMAALDVPVAIQNAPEYIGVGLSAGSIAALASAHRNFTVLKGEGPVVHVQQVVAATGGRVAVFNGRNGQELPDNLRAGCAGMIPATDTFDWQVEIYEAMRAGDEDVAEALYQQVLPAVVFGMQSLDHLVCYGRRMAALRMGLGEEVFDRSPSMEPTAFGLECARRFAEALGPLKM